MKFRFLFLLLLLNAGFARSYYYNVINVNATVNADGSLNVIEEWVMTFDGTYNEVYRKFYNEIKSFSVKGYAVTYSNGEHVWKGPWTDSTERFILEYVIIDPFTVTQEFDRLYSTLVFRDRDVTVLSSTNFISFPSSINTDNYRVNRGRVSKINDRTLMIVDNNVPANTPLDFEITLPKGVIRPPDSFKNLLTLFPDVFSVLMHIPLIIVFILIAFDFINFFKIKLKKSVDESFYDHINPESLPPAIAEVLTTNNATVKSVTATIIDLSVKGYIYIHKIIKQFWPDEIKFVKVKSGTERLNAYEVKVMTAIFKNKSEVSLSDVSRNFRSSMTLLDGITKKIHEEVVKLGLNEELISDEIFSNAFKVTKLSIVSFFILVITAFISSLLNYSNSSFFLTLFSFVFIDVGAIIILGFLSRGLMELTPKGENARRTYLSLRNFIKRYPLTDGRVFDTYLPYAIALGVQKEWVRKAKDLEYNPRWHDSSINTLSLIAISSSINSSIAPRSSGGGGGGFGGGGGAGGGGGGAR